MEDIIILSPTPGDHIKRGQSVLRLIGEADVTLKLKKCQSFLDAIDYPGHVSTPGRLRVVTKTKAPIRTLNYPTNTTELRSFSVSSTYTIAFSESCRKKALPWTSYWKRGNRRNPIWKKKRRASWTSWTTFLLTCQYSDFQGMTLHFPSRMTRATNKLVLSPAAPTIGEAPSINRILVMDSRRRSEELWNLVARMFWRHMGRSDAPPVHWG